MSWTRSGNWGGWSVVIGILCTAVELAGCASAGGGLERFEHRKLGYSIPYPERLDPSTDAVWKRLRVEHADLAYRGPGDAMIAISSRCDDSQTDPVLLGRQLLIGLRNRTRLQSERFEFAGGHAFSQVVKAREAGVPVRTKTVTWVRGGCVIDWVLAAPDFLPGLEATFDLWWQGFDPGRISGGVPSATPVHAPPEDLQEAGP